MGGAMPVEPSLPGPPDAPGDGPDASEPELEGSPLEVAAIRLEERKERRESSTAIWTQRFSFATLIVSICVAGVTAWNAHLNIRSGADQAAASLAAEERQADKGFMRDQRTKAYAALVSSANASSDSFLHIAQHLSDLAAGDKSVNVAALEAEFETRLNAVLTDEDLVKIVSSNATYDAAHKAVDLVLTESDAVGDALTKTKTNKLTEEDVRNLWNVLTASQLPEALGAFVDSGRNDLGIAH
jgi:hypothetical protein